MPQGCRNTNLQKKRNNTDQSKNKWNTKIAKINKKEGEVLF